MDENNMDRAQFFHALHADGLFGAHLSRPVRQLGCGNPGGTINWSYPGVEKRLSRNSAQDFESILHGEYLHERELVAGVVSTATCPCETVLRVRLWRDFCVVLKGYAGWAEHWCQREVARKRSLRTDSLRT